MDILVFKTNLTKPALVNRIQPVMHKIPGIKRWNVDLQDCDHVLRIEGKEISARTIETVLQEAGIFCEELQD